MKEIIDEKDRKILDILKENSRLSSHKVSKKSGIPVTTVNNRIKKLQKEKIIKKFTIDIDRIKMGLPIAAYVFITISLKELKELNMDTKDLINNRVKNYYIEIVEHLTGEYDLLVKIHAADLKELNEFVVNRLTKFRGVEKTTTALVLGRAK